MAGRIDDLGREMTNQRSGFQFRFVLRAKLTKLVLTSGYEMTFLIQSVCCVSYKVKSRYYDPLEKYESFFFTLFFCSQLQKLEQHQVRPSEKSSHWVIMLFYYTEVACLAGGIVVPRVLSWRRNRHAKQEANPIFKRLRARRFTVPYFSLRSSRSSALRYGRPSWMQRASNLLKRRGTIWEKPSLPPLL